jgi:hypothetical protein
MPAHACTAFFDYEIMGSMSKVCVYNHLGDPVSITVRAYDLCPITIQVSH